MAHNQVPELQNVADRASTYIHNAVHSNNDDPQPPSLPVSHGLADGLAGRSGSGSTASRVSVDYFDPAGIAQLRRTMTAQSRVADTQRHLSADTESTLCEPDSDDFDFKKLLQKLMRRMDDSHVKQRELGVMFDDLKVVGLGASASYQETLGSLLNPFNIGRNINEVRHKPTRDILSGFEGVVKPGEMLLVLGRPGSGCSTLLKTIANQRKEYHLVSGDVHYDSFEPEVIARHYRGDVVYCPEDDIHFPTLTVDETLRFAVKTRIPRMHFPGQSTSEYVRKVVDVLETVFGLRHVKDTPVGDNRVRGISGGQKKRVSIAEALATRSKIGAWDNSTRGLDASTAVEFIRALRIATDVGRITNIVSIYQAGEQLYELFDKVCIIYEGKMAYFGPADQARQYFIDMGYEPAHRQTTADFLVAVTDPAGRITRSTHSGAPPPASAIEFAEHFKRSKIGQSNREEMEQYRAKFVNKPERALAYKESARAERAKRARRASPYTISIPMQARAVMMRRVQIIKGSTAQQFIQLGSYIFQAIIIGTVFLNLKESTSAYFSRGSALFFALLFAALFTMAEIPALFGQRPIVERHQKNAMYHPFIEAVALTLVDIPITFVIIAMYCVIIYFLVGLQTSASQFFIFFLFILTMTLVMKAWFRMLSALFKSPSPAQTVAGVSVLLLALYTDYTIPRSSIVGALRWITRVNPLGYSFAGVMVNEFHTLDGSCSNLIPRGPGYEGISLSNQACGSVGSIPGQNTVDGNRFLNLSYGFTYSDLWRNFGIVVAFGIAFLAGLFYFSEYNTDTANFSTVTLFKRSSRTSVMNNVSASVGSDEEKVATNANAGASPKDNEQVRKEADKAMVAQTKMHDVFSWQHLDYSVPVSGGEMRQLLDDVSGYVVPGKLTALMGESGAGKTTLLNVLAERQTTGVVTGDRFVNGQALPSDFDAQTGYVQQMDTHLDTTTVREALLFSAKMRQPQSVPLVEKEEYVEQCLKMCGLEAYADAIVGSLSVEHRKRTTIGVELAAKPKLLLFLDEPTSGLDSQSAWGVMDFLRKLSSNGTAILCTIHQPSAELFQQFDRLLLLKKGGKIVYFGDLGKNASTLIGYFEQNGGRKIDEKENPAEYMLEVIGAGATASTEVDWGNVWRKSEGARIAREKIERIHAEGRQRPPIQATLKSRYATSWGYQVAALLRRNLQSYWRDPTYVIAKILLNITGGLFIGFTFFRSNNSQQGSQNKLFAIFMATIISVPLANQLQVPFIAIRSVFEIRERPSRMYSWPALITSLILVEIPWNILGSTLFYLCWYWTVGFPTDRAGFMYLAIGILLPMYYTTVGQAIAAMAPDAEIAASLFSVVFSFVITFNGVMQPFRLLGWWKWMYHVSPYTYLISALLGQAVGGSDIECSSIELITIDPPSGTSCGNFMQSYISSSGGYLSNPNATSNCLFCSTRTADQLLGANFNIEYKNRWWHLGLFCVYILFNVFAVFALTWLFRMRKASVFGFLKARFARKQ